MQNKDRLASHQLEFSSIRSEIGRLIDHQRDLMNMSLVAFGGVIALLGVVANLTSNGTPSRASDALLLVPELYAVLAVVAVDLTRRIYQLGDYLANLTSRIRRLTGDTTLWLWEDWKVADYEKKSARDKVITSLLDKGRWLVLLVPGFVAVSSWFALPHTDLRNHLLPVAFAIFSLLLTLLLIIATGEVAGVPELRSRSSAHAP